MKTLAIFDLIQQRCKDLSISQNELIVRSGTTNIAKGHRRLQQIFDGDFNSSRGLIDKLPQALGVTRDAIDAAIDASEKQISDEIDAAWRANFKPHALAITANNGRPRQITMAAICNAGRHVRVDFPDRLDVLDYRDYALTKIRHQASEISKFFFELEGFVINYSPDEARKFNLRGEQTEVVSQAIKAGNLSFTIR